MKKLIKVEEYFFPVAILEGRQGVYSPTPLPEKKPSSTYPAEFKICLPYQSVAQYLNGAPLSLVVSLVGFLIVSYLPGPVCSKAD